MKLNENCFISTSCFVLIQGYEIAFTYWICGDIKIIGKIPKITYNVKELGVKVFLQFNEVFKLLPSKEEKRDSPFGKSPF